MRNWESKAFKKTGILCFCSRLDPRIKPGLTSGIRHQIPALLPENPLPTLVPRFRGNSRDSPPGREFWNTREWNSRGAGKAGFSRPIPDFPSVVSHAPGRDRNSRELLPNSDFLLGKDTQRVGGRGGGNSKEFSGKRGGSSGFPFGKNSRNSQVFPLLSFPRKFWRTRIPGGNRAQPFVLPELPFSKEKREWGRGRGRSTGNIWEFCCGTAREALGFPAGSRLSRREFQRGIVGSHSRSRFGPGFAPS